MAVGITKEESIRWINHAIAFYANLGKKQKEMAADFGLEPSRLSDLKNPKKPLKVSKNQIEKIIELCGSPKRDPGRFEYAELYDNLDSFFEHFIPVTVDRFYKSIHKNLSEPETITNILDKCDFETTNREKQVLNINQLVRSHEFSLLCTDEGFNKSSSKTDKEYFLSLIKSYGINGIDEDVFLQLRQLYLLIKVLPDFELGKQSNPRISFVVPKTQVVLTGSRVAAFMSDDQRFNYPVNKLINDKLNKESSSISIYSEIPKPDYWRDIRVEVYLSENMNYYILIHLSQKGLLSKDLSQKGLLSKDLSYQSTIPEGYSWCNFDAMTHKQDRIAVIKNINSLDLFKEIKKLREWQGLDEDNLYELKQNIASSGGHVAGATVLT